MMQWLLWVEEEVVLLVGVTVLSLLLKMKAEMSEVVEIGGNKNDFTGESNSGIDDEVEGDKEQDDKDSSVKLEEEEEEHRSMANPVLTIVDLQERQY